MKSLFDHSDLDKLAAVIAAVHSHPLMAQYRRAREALHRWMFGHGTRAIELLNATVLLFWGVALLDDRLLATFIYLGTAVWQHEWANEALSGLFFVAAMFSVGGWMSDAHKDEWLHDYETYHALVGKNGYIDAIRDAVVAMPTEPPEGASDAPVRCVGRPAEDEPGLCDSNQTKKRQEAPYGNRA